MGKVTIQEIAKILIEKNKLSPKEASRFAATMFEVIQQRLDQEELVKIKGFGTFKMIRVESRESISVRTGERVIINSHAKITFTPDATMKELVNKPFSQFETVILNDGVEFEDLADDLPEEELTEGDSAEEKTLAPLMELVEEEPETSQQQTSVQTEESVIIDEDGTCSWKKLLGYTFLTLSLMAASAYGGYWYGQKTTNTVTEETAIEEIPIENIDSIAIEPLDSIEFIDDKISESTQPELPETEEPKPKVKKEQDSKEEPFWKKYEAMDARVRTGAYHIIGTDHEVKVRKGENLTRIARRELGDGMSCYIEVYNGLNADTELREGQIIKIPKLKWKKKR